MPGHFRVKRSDGSYGIVHADLVYGYLKRGFFHALALEDGKLVFDGTVIVRDRDGRSAGLTHFRVLIHYESDPAFLRAVKVVQPAGLASSVDLCAFYGVGDGVVHHSVTALSRYIQSGGL